MMSELVTVLPVGEFDGNTISYFRPKYRKTRRGKHLRFALAALARVR